MSEHVWYQIFLYLTILGFFGTAVVTMVTARSRGTQWTAFCMVMFFLENVITFPAALLGYEPYQWLIGNPVTTLYLAIVLVGVASASSAVWVYSRFTQLPAILTELPPVRIEDALVDRGLYAISAVGAIASIGLSAAGYAGYYLEETLSYEVPTWLGIARVFLNISLAMSFVVFLSVYSRDRGRMAAAWLLAGLWSLAGLATAFKMYVILPFAFGAIAAWLNRRLRGAHVVVVVAAVFLAYGIVEPMRQLRYETNYTAVESIAAVLTGRGNTAADSPPVLERVMQRADYTVTGVEALEADRDGRLVRLRARLEHTYQLIPLLAYIPAALWPGKPLADLGRDLSIALTGIETNSVTPSHVVASYLWFGFFGVALNSVAVAFFFVLGGRLLERYGAQPTRYVPLLFLVLVFSFTGAVMAYHYISIIRALTVVAIFYAVVDSLGLTERLAGIPPRTRSVARPRR